MSDGTIHKCEIIELDYDDINALKNGMAVICREANVVITLKEPSDEQVLEFIKNADKNPIRKDIYEQILPKRVMEQISKELWGKNEDKGDHIPRID